MVTRLDLRLTRLRVTACGATLAGPAHARAGRRRATAAGAPAWPGRRGRGALDVASEPRAAPQGVRRAAHLDEREPPRCAARDDGRRDRAAVAGGDRTRRASGARWRAIDPVPTLDRSRLHGCAGACDSPRRHLLRDIAGKRAGPHWRSVSPMRVLFVCTGNTCRSVMAEYLARRIAAERNLDARHRQRRHGRVGRRTGLRRCAARRASSTTSTSRRTARGCSRASSLEGYELVLAMGPHHLERVEAIGGQGTHLPAHVVWLARLHGPSDRRSLWRRPRPLSRDVR